MPYFRQLIGEKCYLSPIDKQDAEAYCRWLNDLHISRYLDASLSLVPETEMHAIDMLRPQNKIFGIVDKATDTLIGSTGLHDLDFIHSLANFGIFIGEPHYQGKGYGREATQLVLDFGFNVLGLKNIQLFVFDYNHHAIKLYLKLGFKEIGRRRKARFFAGKRHDVIIMDLLDEEFESVYVNKLLE